MFPALRKYALFWGTAEGRAPPFDYFRVSHALSLVLVRLQQQQKWCASSTLLDLWPLLCAYALSAPENR